MKIRQGFVSNSSSSSFFVTLSINHSVKENLREVKRSFSLVKATLSGSRSEKEKLEDYRRLTGDYSKEYRR